jgi:hypothetical protein
VAAEGRSVASRKFRSTFKPAVAAGPALDLSAVDRALRALHDSCTRAGRVMPQPYAATIDGPTVNLRFSPAESRPPLPWTTTDAGRTWSADAAWLDLRGVPGPAPYPHLVALGPSAEGWTLVNFDRAFGIVSVQGDPRRSRQLAQDLAVQLTSNPWTENNTGTLVGLDADTVPKHNPRLRIARTLGEFFRSVHAEELSAAMTRADGDSGAPVQLDATSVVVLQGRRPAEGAAERRGFVIVDDTPGSEDRTRLLELAAHPSAPWAVLVVGDVPGARWQIDVDADGAARIDVLGISTGARS